ncbi:nucleoside-diphosphate sugar epimerase/dehydratase [uncultured Lutibacter sp.]|uniref:nucleoside-diphosphate sugar epimerase/dehydratase n=1 Tax=uncultured Lutibacter sp. TaxID=437739 RepID=UPI00262ECD7B|nr:nucleoside-diphosphate sugar epimerase/dehydratase [uncultured Lutibacter sp.]
MLKKIINNNTLRYLVLLFDINILVITFILTVLIASNFKFNMPATTLVFYVIWYLIIACISFLFVGSYKGIVRQSDFKNLIRITKSNLLIMLVVIGLMFVSPKLSIVSFSDLSFSVVFIHFILSQLFFIISRFLYKELYYLIISDVKYEKRVLIYGTGELGKITYKVLTEETIYKLNVIGFIENNIKKVNNELYGLRIFNFKEVDNEFVFTKKIDEIIIACQLIKPNQLLQIVNTLSKLPVKIKIVPTTKNWIANTLKTQQITPLKIEDLLGRTSIQLNNPNLKTEFNGKVIVITGAAGSIGCEIAKQIANYNFKNLVLIDSAESSLYNLQQYFIHKKNKNITAIVADIRNSKRMEEVFKKIKPQIVFHAAAYKHVPFMEENPYEAVSTNVLGTKIIADISLKYKVNKVVLVSTDKAVNPTSIMGATKRVAEMYINSLQQEGNTKFITTRFGNVLGSNGSVIHLFKSQIKNGGPITVTHKDVTRFFMTVSEACQLVIEAGVMGNGGEIFVFDMGNSIKIYDLALNMIHLSGLKFPDDIDIKITGLRAGEKIYEEVLRTDETTTVTHHKKILIAKVKKFNANEIICNINELCKLNEQLDDKNTVIKMKEIVPEFKSNNSAYEKLDF